MDILFRKNKLKKVCSSMAAMTTAFGPRLAAVLKRRLDDLHAANNLGELRHGPGRLHQLSADLASSFSLDLVHPNRLVFVCANSPVPAMPDGVSIDWDRVTAVEIVDVIDTHNG